MTNVVQSYERNDTIGGQIASPFTFYASPNVKLGDKIAMFFAHAIPVAKVTNMAAISALEKDPQTRAAAESFKDKQLMAGFLPAWG